MRLRKVISGGQTGVDQAGLRAAQAAGFETGGFIPKGFRTQAGPNPLLGPTFGLVETKSDQYPPRTMRNVETSDMTVIFGDPRSRGCRLTIKYCEYNRKHYIIVRLTASRSAAGDYNDGLVEELYQDLKIHDPAVLNIAGNREEIYPGIGVWTESIMGTVLRRLRETA